MKSFYHFFSQLVYISHPAAGSSSLSDIKKRKKKKMTDLPNKVTPDSFNVRGNNTRKQEWSPAGAP
jgi:hypothetical protein